MLVQAVIKQMHDAGLDTDFVVELHMLEAIMERWARQGRPEGAEALDAAQTHLAAALKSPSVPRKCALHEQRCECGRTCGMLSRGGPAMNLWPSRIVGPAACEVASKDTMNLLTCLCAGWQADSVQW